MTDYYPQTYKMVSEIIGMYGIEAVLATMIHRLEDTNELDEAYVDVLINDLRTALHNYKARYDVEG